MTDFAGDGRFCNFSSDEKLREKDLTKNISKQLRLRTAVECHNERKRVLQKSPPDFAGEP